MPGFPSISNAACAKRRDAAGTGTRGVTDPAAAGFDPRPALAFRVGVTGTRAIPPGQEAALQDKVHTLLTQVAGLVVPPAPAGHHGHAYATPPQDAPEASLCLVSPLAEGADRLVAAVAVALGYALQAPLPFPQAEYEKDFTRTASPPDSLATFRALLARAGDPPDAHVLELDGGRGEDETRSYEAVGHLVVQNCDLLIAIWDGRFTGKRGGTSEIVRYAARAGLPVWWIHTDPDQPERLLDDPLQLRRPDLAQTGAPARASLAAYIDQTLRPPHTHGPHHPGLLGRCMHLVCRIARLHGEPLADYFAEHTLPKTGWRHWLGRISGVHRWFMGVVGGPPDPEAPLPPALGPVEAYWESRYRHADALSGVYGNLYRSSYVLVFGLAAAALAGVLVGLAARRLEAPAIAVETLSLLCILGLVMLNQSHRWHERWITYRLLAELCRKQRTLALLGRALPGVEISGLATDAAPEHGVTGPPRESWVGWIFAAAQRAAPLPAGPLAGRAVHHAGHVGRGLLAGQIAYHADRLRRARAASRRLATWGELFFLVTVVIVGVRIVRLIFSPEPSGVDVLALLGGLLPTASAGLVGIRAYAEFDLLAQESARMLRIMTRAEERLCGMNLDVPLASQDLGTELSAVTMAMLQDVKGWAQLFRVKAVETG
jgi:hypothetical protein